VAGTETTVKQHDGGAGLGSLLKAALPSVPVVGSLPGVRKASADGFAGLSYQRPPVTIEATVVGVSRVEETGETVVNVSVPKEKSADLAARAATGRVALVVDGGQ